MSYDYLIAGGGAAGLSLAYYLKERYGDACRILIVERDVKNRNDRTWSYWTERSTPFDDLAYGQWDEVTFVGGGQHLRLPLNGYRYQTVRGIDFYRRMDEALVGVARVRADITDVRDTPDGAEIVADGEIYRGRWAFDSRFGPNDLRLDAKAHHLLWQHFRGWVVETDTDAFDPKRPYLFDFRTPQRGAMRFMYVLPFSPRRALVEYTLFSDRLLPEAEYEAALRTYIADVLGLDTYEIAEREQGMIPMTDYPFRRRAGRHVMNIGTRGGQTKASTGYTFTRILRDSERIVASLDRHGHPFANSAQPARYLGYDSLLLQITRRHGEAIERIFADLFRNNPIRRVLRFLDEETHPAEDLGVMASVPPLPFITALVKVKLLRQL